MASSAAEGASASGQDALPGMEQFFAKLFNSSEDSDLIIRCGGKQWDVHRHIVCPRSKYFDRACAGGFEESNSGIINFKDDDPLIVDRVLLYLYTADYPDLLTDTFEGSPASQLTGEQGSELLATHTQVYAIADRLDIQELRQASNRKFKEAFDSCSPDDFAAVVLEVLQSTPENDQGLRKTVKKLCAGIFDEAGADPEDQEIDLDRKSWKTVLSNDPGFALDISLQMARKHRKEAIQFKERMSDSQVPSCSGADLWSTIHVGMEIVCACLPPLWPLATRAKIIPSAWFSIQRRYDSLRGRYPRSHDLSEDPSGSSDIPVVHQDIKTGIMVEDRRMDAETGEILPLQLLRPIRVGPSLLPARGDERQLNPHHSYELLT